MSFLFNKKPRAPAELVKSTKENLAKLDGTDNKANAKVRPAPPCFPFSPPTLALPLGQA